jgi:hypothetical protein
MRIIRYIHKDNLLIRLAVGRKSVRSKESCSDTANSQDTRERVRLVAPTVPQRSSVSGAITWSMPRNWATMFPRCR